MTRESISNLKNLINEDLGLSWLTPNNDKDEMFLSIPAVIDEFEICILKGDGQLRAGSESASFYARPVFFLTSDIELTDDGEGTIESPFRVVGIE